VVTWLPAAAFRDVEIVIVFDILVIEAHSHVKLG
jgi:hypothetical protein